MGPRKPSEQAIRKAVKVIVDYGSWFRWKHGPDLKRRLTEIKNAEKRTRTKQHVEG